MDYPDVTFVLQMGSTTKEQYTHRLGRTARAGKEGSGLLLCAPFEMSALQRDLRDMPLVVAEPPMLAGEVRVSFSHCHGAPLTQTLSPLHQPLTLLLILSLPPHYRTYPITLGQ